MRAGTQFESSIPPRLDRLPWSPWHWRLVVALGVAWMLDGLEVTIVGSVASVLGEPGTLALSYTQIGAAGSAYLAGAVVGSLFFGKMADHFGRKRLFLVTLGLYLAATVGTALSWGFVSFAVFRALTGAGIGGEAAAMHSAIDELIPARLRGRVDLAINGTYWLGTAIGAGASLVFLDERLVPRAIGWRLAFGLGAALGFSIVLVRRCLPESPRWLLLRGRIEQAESVVSRIERDVARGCPLPPAPGTVRLTARGSATFSHVAHVLFVEYPRRTALGLSLMIAQAFAYNAVFFTYALVLTRFYGIAPGRVGLYLLPFAIGNLCGPLVLGPLFDTIGRRTMIASTYAVAALLLALTGWGFAHGWLDAVTQTIMWCIVFFVASAAASSAYLTVSELFPVELRSMAVAFFYAVGTGVGGLAAPTLFGKLIASGSRYEVFVGYLVGAGLMAAAAGVAWWLGISAEGRSLEEITEGRPPESLDSAESSPGPLRAERA
ncbi:MAG TPA: MFS transporter [Polyangiaceae bacterium]|nr:MFS transporter [Polyangiaceae bacterium]